MFQTRFLNAMLDDRRYNPMQQGDILTTDLHYTYDSSLEIIKTTTIGPKMWSYLLISLHPSEHSNYTIPNIVDKKVICSTICIVIIRQARGPECLKTLKGFCTHASTASRNSRSRTGSLACVIPWQAAKMQRADGCS